MSGLGLPGINLISNFCEQIQEMMKNRQFLAVDSLTRLPSSSLTQLLNTIHSAIQPLTQPFNHSLNPSPICKTIQLLTQPFTQPFFALYLNKNDKFLFKSIY